MSPLFWALAGSGQAGAEWPLCAASSGWGDGCPGWQRELGLARLSRGAGQCPAEPHIAPQPLSFLPVLPFARPEARGRASSDAVEAVAAGRLWKRRRLLGAARDQRVPCRSSTGPPAPRQPRRGQGRLAQSSLNRGKGDFWGDSGHLGGADLWGRVLEGAGVCTHGGCAGGTGP